MIRRIRIPALALGLTFSVHAAQPAPYDLGLLIDIPIIAAGAGLKYHSGQALSATRDNPIDLAAVDRGDLHPMDRWAAGNYDPGLSFASGGLATAGLMVPFALNAADLWRKEQTWWGAFADFVILQEALAVSSSLVSYSKAVLKLHPTPLVYGSEAPVEEKRARHNVSSFFSGHTTAAFTTAVFTGYTYQLRHPGSPLVPWVWGGSLAAAAGVGALRIAAGKHFPSDILAAAAVGSLCGYLLPRLHLRPGHGRKGGAAKQDGEELGFTLAASPVSSVPVPTAVLSF